MLFFVFEFEFKHKIRYFKWAPASAVQPKTTSKLIYFRAMELSFKFKNIFLYYVEK